MNGVSFLTDESNHKIAVVINREVLEQYREDAEDFLDGLIASMCEDDETVPLNEVIERLRKEGKLP